MPQPPITQVRHRRPGRRHRSRSCRDRRGGRGSPTHPPAVESITGAHRRPHIPMPHPPQRPKPPISLGPQPRDRRESRSRNRQPPVTNKRDANRRRVVPLRVRPLLAPAATLEDGAVGCDEERVGNVGPLPCRALMKRLNVPDRLSTGVAAGRVMQDAHPHPRRDKVRHPCGRLRTPLGTTDDVHSSAVYRG